MFPSHDPIDQSRVWDFTDFTRGDERLAWWQNLEYNYLFIAEENCPKTQRLHWQSRIIFKRMYRFAQLKKIFPPDVHFEAAKAIQDFNYGKKWGSKIICEIDHRKKGARPIFGDQKKAIQDGATLRECIDLPGANWQSLRSAELCMSYLEPAREYGDIQVIWVNNGSEKFIYDKEPNLYKPPIDGDHLKYWTGYDAHEAVLIDCLAHKITVPTLRQWIGPAPFRLNTKGGCRQARYKRIYVQRPPAELEVGTWRVPGTVV